MSLNMKKVAYIELQRKRKQILDDVREGELMNPLEGFRKHVEKQILNDMGMFSEDDTRNQRIEKQRTLEQMSQNLQHKNNNTYFSNKIVKFFLLIKQYNLTLE